VKNSAVTQFGVSCSSGVIPKPGAVQPGDQSRGERCRCSRDPFGFAQGRHFTPPEERLRSGWPPWNDLLSGFKL